MAATAKRGRRPSVTALLALAAVMRRQFGVVTTAQAADVGVSSQRIAELVQAGAIRRLYRGVYVSAQYPDSWEAQWMAGLLAAGPEAVISGRAAAFLHELRHVHVTSRPDLEVTIPRTATRWRGGPDVVTEVHLTDEDRVQVGSWLLTSVAWTIFTLAHRLGVDQTEKALDAVVADGALTIPDAGRTAARFRHCTGMPVIREVLSRLDPAVRLTRSEAERLFRRILRKAGLPLPAANVAVRDADGGRRYLDFAYEDLRIAIEIDVHVDHGRSVGRRHDGHRQNALTGTWRILRFDEVDLRYAPERVVRDVRRALVGAGVDLPPDL